MADNGLMAVFMANRSALVRFLRARGAGEEAEDLVQDLWLKVAASSLGPVADPLSYLYRVANNLMIDRHRSATRRRGREESWSGRRADEDDLSGEPSAERSLLSRERLNEIERRLDALGHRTAAILRRFRLDGIGQRQIAVEQGISVSAVEKHLRKAYRLLTAVRADDAEPEGPRRIDVGGSADAGR